MSALSRVLREDGKRSMELMTNIVSIFYHFSDMTEVHGILTTNKVGDLTLRVVAHGKSPFKLKK